MKSPKAPKPTAQELAGVQRQSRMLDEETEEMEKRLKSAARGKLGSQSMLAKGGSPKSKKSGKSMITPSNYSGGGGGSSGGSGSGSGGGSGTGGGRFNKNQRA